jgi:hypothetical protein
MHSTVVGIIAASRTQTDASFSDPRTGSGNAMDAPLQPFETLAVDDLPFLAN